MMVSRAAHCWNPWGVAMATPGTPFVVIHEAGDSGCSNWLGTTWQNMLPMC